MTTVAVMLPYISSLTNQEGNAMAGQTRTVTRDNRISKRHTERWVVRWTEDAPGYAGTIYPSERAYISLAAAESYAAQLRKHQPCTDGPIVVAVS